MAPRLREDLVSTTADEQGVACVEVTNPATSVSFRFYDFEYELAKQLTGQPLDGVVAWASATYGVDLSVEALGEFIDKLKGLGFLEPDEESARSAGAAKPTGTAGNGEPAGSESPVVPGVHVLAGPLPPVTIEEEPDGAGAAAAPSTTLGAPKVAGRASAPRSGARASGSDRPPAAGSPPDAGLGKTPLVETSFQENPFSPVALGETPLGAIAGALGSVDNAGAPQGALDLGAPSSPVSAPGKSGGIAALGSGRSAIPERRQPPRPEVVVMPPMAEASAGIAVPKRRSSAWLVVVLVLGAAGIAAAVWTLRPQPKAPEAPPPSPTAVNVKVVAPQPTTFYRWFEVVGAVTPGRDETLGFPSGGRLQSAMPPGTTFTGGETIARLQGVAARELLVNKARSRVVYFEQLRDSSRAEGAEGAARQAEAKLSQKRQELSAAESSLAQLEIHPKVAGEIAEVLVPKFAILKAGQPVFRIRATGPRAAFAFSKEDAAKARGLGFCRVETIPGTGGGVDAGTTESAARAIDCNYGAPGGAGEPRLVVELAGAGAVHPGTGVRLASARYDGVFPVPRSTVTHAGDQDRLWVVAAEGRAVQSRVVEVAATVEDQALVAHGLAVGESVVIDAPSDLKDGAEVNVSH